MISASFYISATNLAEFPDDNKPHIAMVGRSNVGKSSMINHLAQQKKLARVSSEPGRTQTINLYTMDDRFYLVDLPGYGYAKTSKEKRAEFSTMIHEYLEHTAQLKLVLLIIDARIPATDLDATMLEWLQQTTIPFIIVMNKMDKVKPTDAQKLHQLFQEKYPGVRRIEHSILSGKNQKEIWSAIESALRTASRGEMVS
ncbi:MAG: ribosome biogenesis GTP-binding protein YihA/YsxC [Patescibacteria group bacterium]